MSTDTARERNSGGWAFAVSATALSGPAAMQRLPSKAVQGVCKEIIKIPG